MWLKVELKLRLVDYRRADDTVFFGDRPLNNPGYHPFTLAGSVGGDAANANHTIPIVGTLTPLSGSRADWADDSEACSELIRALAAQAGVRLADVAAAFD